LGTYCTSSFLEVWRGHARHRPPHAASFFCFSSIAARARCVFFCGHRASRESARRAVYAACSRCLTIPHSNSCKRASPKSASSTPLQRPIRNTLSQHFECGIFERPAAWTNWAMSTAAAPPKSRHPAATHHTHSLPPSAPSRGGKGPPPAESGQGGTPDAE